MGYITLGCGTCHSAPDQVRDAWGCENPAQTAVWIDEEGAQFFNCPGQFLTHRESEFGDYVSYCKEFPGTALGFYDCSNRFFEAWKYYNGKKAEYRELLDRRNKKKR